jgi:hypothetical protein
LKKQGYTGEIYIVCSTDDKTIEKYKEKYSDNVLIFDKSDYKGKFDIADNFDKDNVVVYARNAIWDIVKKIGVKYFLVLDDDYTVFRYQLRDITKKIKNLDKIFNMYIHFLANTNIHSVAFSQGGDFIGGENNNYYKNGLIAKKRKIMNCFFNDIDRPYYFYGRINEDVNCYIQNGKTGTIFLTQPIVSVQQKQTQANSGGLTEFYLDTGTYIKSFYTVIFNPSAIRCEMMRSKHSRIHHRISWKNAVPVIIREEYKND